MAAVRKREIRLAEIIFLAQRDGSLIIEKGEKWLRMTHGGSFEIWGISKSFYDFISVGNVTQWGNKNGANEPIADICGEMKRSPCSFLFESKMPFVRVAPRYAINAGGLIKIYRGAIILCSAVAKILTHVNRLNRGRVFNNELTRWLWALMLSEASVGGRFYFWGCPK